MFEKYSERERDVDKYQKTLSRATPTTVPCACEHVSIKFPISLEQSKSNAIVFTLWYASSFKQIISMRKIKARKRLQVCLYSKLK